MHSIDRVQCRREGGRSSRPTPTPDMLECPNCKNWYAHEQNICISLLVPCLSVGTLAHVYTQVRVLDGQAPLRRFHGSLRDAAKQDSRRVRTPRGHSCWASRYAARVNVHPGRDIRERCPGHIQPCRTQGGHTLTRRRAFLTPT